MSRTSTVAPLTRPTPETSFNKAVAGIRTDPTKETNASPRQSDGCPKSEVCLGIGKCSYAWPGRNDSMCVVPLPEECWERREVEINIDVWENGGQNRDGGNHLDQVTQLIDNYRNGYCDNCCCFVALMLVEYSSTQKRGYAFNRPFSMSSFSRQRHSWCQ